MTVSNRPSLEIPASILVLVICSLFVYLPGVDGGFQFDDYPNILNNKTVHIKDFSKEELKNTLFNDFGAILQRPISMLTFAINYHYSKLSPYPFKLTNIIIHTTNSILLFLLSMLLIKRLYNNKLNTRQTLLIALFIATCWATHPINLPPALYVVQRMTSLSAFFVILGLMSYIKARDLTEKSKHLLAPIFLIAAIFFGLLAIMSKENGSLLFIYIPLIEIIAFQAGFLKSKAKPVYNGFFILTLIIPILTVSTYSLLDPDWFMDGYSSTSFTITERILTESRIIWLYISWIILPNNQSLGLFHDDIIISTGLLSPLTTLSSIIGIVATIGILAYNIRRHTFPGITLGVSIFLASQLMESTILPLELAHEHRNYIGSYGILLAIASCYPHIKRKKRTIVTISFSVFLVMLIFLSYNRSSNWAYGIRGAFIEAQNHPNSSAAHYELGRQYIILGNTKDPAYYDKARQQLNISANLSETRADALFALITLPQIDKKSGDTRKLLPTLIHRIANSPLYASHANWLVTLDQCSRKNTCTITDSDLYLIAKTLLNHKDIERREQVASVVYATAGSILHRTGTGSYQESIRLLGLAATTTPANPEFKKSLIIMALENNDIITANKWIDKLHAQTGLNYKIEIPQTHNKTSAHPHQQP